jgi:hypothetical protein
MKTIFRAEFLDWRFPLLPPNKKVPNVSAKSHSNVR